MFNQTANITINEKVEVLVLNESSILLSLTPDYLAKNSQSLVNRNELMRTYSCSIVDSKPDWLIDCVLSYDTVLIEYDCLSVDHYAVLAYLKNLNIIANKQFGKTHKIEVCYELDCEQYASDMGLVSAHTSLRTSDIVALHTSQLYSVFAIGFMPNFAYLGEVNDKLSMPRLPNPRLKVPAGAVAIADNQTAIYPSVSPGGWHILGYAPSFIVKCMSPVFSSGDKVQFKEISPPTFNQRLDEYSSQKV